RRRYVRNRPAPACKPASAPRPTRRGAYGSFSSCRLSAACARSRESGRRSGRGGAGPGSCLPQGGQAGQVAFFDELQGGSPTGGEVVDLVVQTEQLEGTGAVPAPHHGEGLGGGDSLGYRLGAGGEP